MPQSRLPTVWRFYFLAARQSYSRKQLRFTLHAVQYTLATKSNSTRSTLSKVDRVALAPIERTFNLGDKNYRLWQSRPSRQHLTFDKSATKSNVSEIVDFVADLLPVLIFVDSRFDIRLCRQCVTGFRKLRYVASSNTRSSPVAERPRDASCLSVVSFNIPTARFFLLPVTAASDLLVRKILLWLGYPMVKKFRRYLYLFWRNSRTWQTHKQTRTRRQTPHDGIGRAYASHRAAKIIQCSCYLLEIIYNKLRSARQNNWYELSCILGYKLQRRRTLRHWVTGTIV